MRGMKELQSKTDFDFARAGLGKAITEYRDKETIYSQGRSANSLFHIEEGGVMLTIQSKRRRPAIITILGPGDIFGELCLAGLPSRMCTATAMGPSSILTIQKKKMLLNLRRDKRASNFLVSKLLSTVELYQNQIVEQLVDTSEQRLARVLVRLADMRKRSQRKTEIPPISQEVLAEMVGTTRSRINVFMKRFRRRGFISHNGAFEVRKSLSTFIRNG